MLYYGKGDRFLIFSDGDYGMKVDDAANDWLSVEGGKIEILDYNLYETDSQEHGSRRHLVIRYKIKETPA